MNRLRIAIIISLLIGTTLNSCKKEEVPTLITSVITNITGGSALCGGTVTNEGTGTIIVRGVCWSTAITPNIGDNKTIDGAGAGTYTSLINSLSPDVTYYVRAYATNNTGTGYGMAMSFATLLADIEGNVFKPVTIGTQVWMAENLKTTKYNDGTNIKLVTDNTEWIGLLTPAYCWYQNNATSYKATYGALYNWYTVNTGKLCPSGWHVPTYADWATLITFLGGDGVAGNKLREQGTTHWFSPNSGATNESGFTALPGAYREDQGVFYYSVGDLGFYWSSTEFNSLLAKNLYIYYGNTVYWNNLPKNFGTSVRCIKN